LRGIQKRINLLFGNWQRPVSGSVALFLHFMLLLQFLPPDEARLGCGQVPQLQLNAGPRGLERVHPGIDFPANGKPLAVGAEGRCLDLTRTRQGDFAGFGSELPEYDRLEKKVGPLHRPDALPRPQRDDGALRADRRRTQAARIRFADDVPDLVVGRHALAVGAEQQRPDRAGKQIRPRPRGHLPDPDIAAIATPAAASVPPWFLCPSFFPDIAANAT